MTFAQSWILTVEMDEAGVFHGLMTVCGDTTLSEPESYVSSGSSKTILEELASVLDATIWSYLAIADGTQAITEYAR